MIDFFVSTVGSIFWLLLIVTSSLGHTYAYQLAREGSELLELFQEVIEEHPKNVIADDQQFENLENNQIGKNRLKKHLSAISIHEL